MPEDDVLQGVREAREAYARQHGFDVRAMVADLREQDERGDWPVVRLMPRQPVGADAAVNLPAGATPLISVPDHHP